MSTGKNELPSQGLKTGNIICITQWQKNYSGVYFK